MQCPKCGWQNPDNAVKCSNCFAELAAPANQPQFAQPQPPQPMQPPSYQPYQTNTAGSLSNVSNLKIWAIIVTTFSALGCNVVGLVLGIIAITKTSSATAKSVVGDLTGAQSDANTALILDIVCTALLFLGILFAIPFWAGFFRAFNSFGSPPRPGF